MIRPSSPLTMLLLRHTRRRDFISLLGGAAAWPLAARAQQPGKLPHIGVLVSASPPHPFADAFWRGLHALGYSEGQNIKVEFRYAARSAIEAPRSQCGLISWAAAARTGSRRSPRPGTECRAPESG
jgi:hypothetical protein